MNEWWSVIFLLALAQDGHPRLAKLENRIVGGSKTEITEIPYQVALLEDKVHVCGGVILSTTSILTAAHCVWDITNINQVSIRAGSTTWDNGGSLHYLTKIKMHPNYKIKEHKFDVAVLTISPCLILDRSRKLIKLATNQHVMGDEVTISGWGDLTYEGRKPRYLQSVKVQVTSQRLCSKWHTNIDKAEFCFGSQTKGLCLGDSGGPVVRNNELLGIMTATVSCGREGDVSSGLDVSDKDIATWIKASMK